MDAVVIVYPYDTDVAPYYLMVANPESDGLTVLDIDTRKLVAVVNVGQEPSAIVVTPDRQYALVLNRRSGDVAVVRIPRLAGATARQKTAPLFTMIPAGSGPVGAAVLRVG
jgi:YVTN family beta-propeller protein